MLDRARMAGLLLAASLALALHARAAVPATGAPTPFDRELTAAKSAMMAVPKKAYEHARAALALTDAQPAAPRHDVEHATATWLMGESMIRNKHPDQALPILDQALTVVQKVAANTKLHGDVLKSRGRAAAALGRVQPALADFQAAYNIYQKAGEPRSQAIALQEIGSIYSDARDYPHVLQYYAQSQETFSKDPALSLTADNNRGFALKDMGKLAEAEAAFRRAYAAAEQMQSGYIEAHILTNIAFTEALQGKYAAASADARKGIALGSADPEARSEKPFLLGVLAKVAADRGDNAAAAGLLDQVFAGVDPKSTPMDYRDFHDLASRVYEATGDRERALIHLRAFKRLDDQGRALAASTNAALVAAKFDFANQAARIATLKAKQAQDQANFTTTLTITLLLAGLIVMALITHAFFTMRRSRNQIQAVNTVLEETNGALEKALKAKTEFLATTSHEIRTPLNGILGMTQVMLADSRITPDMRDRLNLLKTSGDTMSALVNDLLDVAKIETGNLSVKHEAFELRRLLEDSARVWTDQAKNKGLEFRVDVATCPALAVGDGDRLRQVLFNLMSNATKFTEQGWVSLSARPEPAGDGERLVIEVADSGIGIAASDHERVFESFTQLDGGRDRQYAGTGLGLAICRNVSRALGGEISVRSEVGKGSTFTVTLPLTRAEGGDAEDQPLGLLIVDDNPLAQAMLRAFLTDKVGRLEFAATPEAALEAAGRGRFGRLLVDGACLQRQNPDDPMAAVGPLAQAGLPVSVLWPALTPEDEARLQALGAQQVLSKPITPVALLAALTEAGAQTSNADKAQSAGYAA